MYYSSLVIFHITHWNIEKHRFYLHLLYNMYRIFKKLDIFVKAYPRLSFIRRLVYFM